MEIQPGEKFEVMENIQGLVMKDNNGNLWIFGNGKWFKEVKEELIR